MAASTSDYYRSIERAIEKMKLGFSHLCFVRGMPGIGKSFQIERCLKAFGMKYAEINGDVSEAYLYRILYEKNGQVIWFKDVVRLLKGMRSLDLLKAACETTPKRSITNLNYSDKQQDLPPQFAFTGSIIFDYNSLAGLKFQEDFEALTSRGDYIDLVLSYGELCAIMRGICAVEEECQVTEFLIQNYRYCGYNALNLRTQRKAFQTYRYAKEKRLDWRQEVRSELMNQRARVHRLLYPVMGDGPVRTLDLKKYLVRSGMVSTIRSADRRIAEWLELGDLYRISDDGRNFLVSLSPIACLSEARGQTGDTSDSSQLGIREASPAGATRGQNEPKSLSTPNPIPVKRGVTT